MFMGGREGRLPLAIGCSRHSDNQVSPSSEHVFCICVHVSSCVVTCVTDVEVNEVNQPYRQDDEYMKWSLTCSAS